MEDSTNRIWHSGDTHVDTKDRVALRCVADFQEVAYAKDSESTMLFLCRLAHNKTEQAPL